MRIFIVLVVLVVAAAADDTATTVEGRVVDVVGRPVARARVYVLPRQGQPLQTKTDKTGRYRVEVTTLGTHGVVIAIDKAHVFRTVLVQQGVANALDIDVELDTEGGEVIKIEDKRRPEPKVKAKPTVDPRISLPYSDEAVERDAWARAWLLLDVDEQGKVTRLKLLKRPGFDLDAICIEQGLALTFEPARDGLGQPMKTYMLWTFEWPAWGWLIQGNGVAVRRPADSNALHPRGSNPLVAGLNRVAVDGVSMTARIGGTWATPVATTFEGALDRVPCAGSGPLNLDLRNRAYRDCSQPDLEVVGSLPWITRETAATAIAELANPRLMLVEEARDPGSPWPGYIGAGVTGVLAVGTVVAFLQYDKYTSRNADDNFTATLDPEAAAANDRGVDRWGTRALVMTAATLAAGATTVLLWNRRQPKSSFSVQPSDNGAAATYSARF